MKNFFAALFICLLASGSALAAPPAPGMSGNDPDQVNIQAAEGRLKALSRHAPGFALPIAATTYNLAVLRIDFSDNAMTKTLAETTTFFADFKNFYLENSYNFLTAQPSISNGGAGTNGAYRMPQTYVYYVSSGNYRFWDLQRDAIAAATAAGFDFSSSRHIMLYHAGIGAESNDISSTTYLWSVYRSSSVAAGGRNFPGYTVVPEAEYYASPLGTICHEYGHQLGLPDLYHTSNSSNPVGIWSLMDYGSWAGSPGGANPSHLDAWSKQFLGFSAPETVSYSNGANRNLLQAETSRESFLRLPIGPSGVGGDKEYFLLEYRRKSGSLYDKALPGEGLLIWHVDDSIASDSYRLALNNINSGGPTRGVDLVEADGTDAILDRGGTGDPWTNSSVNTVFKSPKSDAYNMKKSGIEVSNISPAGNDSMSLTLKSLYNNPVLLDNSNSRGSAVVIGGANGYVNVSQGESAGIAVNPPSGGTIEVKIYSASRDLVREWKYEAVAGRQELLSWDGKNMDGRTVGTGIYFIRISGGDMNVTKKVAVKR